ncbi:MAG: phospholipase D-like domain-containing protein, partial [Candidatus Magasanikbacteria bacterium]|nr:phospholipase D-like domain-containing protein [Candidatus Magasanikbacteria bacterium]
TYAMRAYWELYAKAGMKLYLVRRMLHAKAMMVDGKVAFVGSSNFDSQTFYRSHEINLIFSNKKMIVDLKKIFGNWRKTSRLFSPLRWEKRSRKHRFWEFWAKILKPFL